MRVGGKIVIIATLLMTNLDVRCSTGSGDISTIVTFTTEVFKIGLVTTKYESHADQMIHPYHPRRSCRPAPPNCGDPFRFDDPSL